MMSNFKKQGSRGKSRGFIKVILIIVLALIILGYFGFDVREILNKPLVKDNLNYVWNFVVFIWNHYLETPIMFVWDKIIINLIWNNIKGIFN